MSRRRRVKDKKIEQYEHRDAERLNNPPVGLVTSELDPVEGKKMYEYDPHLDPQLDWAGKTEHTNFEVDTVSLHVHERIDPKTIIQAVRRQKLAQQDLASFFDSPLENPPLRDAIEFYRHEHGWSNRLIAGDSLLVMNSLLEKEGMSGKVQMVYMDPPYGIKYGSNFQPFINKRNVIDGKDDDLTQEPEMIKAFRDTWELGVHSYLTYLRDRLLLAKELLSESGSIFIQISDENIHYVRLILDEVFNPNNFCALIPFRKKTMPFGTKLLEQMDDFLLWYARSKSKVKYRQLYSTLTGEGDWHYQWANLPDGKIIKLSKRQVSNHDLIPQNADIFRLKSLEPSGPMASGMYNYEFNNKIYSHPKNGYGVPIEGMKRLEDAERLAVDGNRLNYKLYIKDSNVTALTIPWQDTIGPRRKIFAVQTSKEIIKRCILMTTDPGDLVLDPTCGSGTTAFVSEEWGRRWITCDTSRVAIAISKQRLLTEFFNYNKLSNPVLGVRGGFLNKKASRVTLNSIANNSPPDYIELFDQPEVDSTKIRITGPFTVEAVPAPLVIPITEIEFSKEADRSITREGETLRQSELRSELLNTGIRARNGQKINFTRVGALSGTHWLHADAETKEDEPKRAVISFGPKYAPLDQRQVELAIEEAQKLVPRPKLIIFASFLFDPEASKDVDETDWPGVTLVKVQMNTDLLTEDLKKERASNESFWLVGQPDVKLLELQEGEYQVEVQGFDYYNPTTGEIESGGTEKIAMWMLDTDYDYRSLFPRQVFFPMANDREGWSRLARNLKSEIDEDLIEQYRGTISLPFSIGENKSIAIKIVDDRGIESLKIIKVD